MTTADHRPVGDVLKRRCDTSNLYTSVEQRLYIEVPVRWRNSSDGPSGCAVVELEQNAQQFAASNVDKRIVRFILPKKRITSPFVVPPSTADSRLA